MHQRNPFCDGQPPRETAPDAPDLVVATTRYRAAVDAHNAAMARVEAARQAKNEADEAASATREAQDLAFTAFHRAALAGRYHQSW